MHALCIRAKVPVSQLRSQINPDDLTKIQREWLDKQLVRADNSEAMRLHDYLGRILNGVEGEKHIAEAFRQIPKRSYRRFIWKKTQPAAL